MSRTSSDIELEEDEVIISYYSEEAYDELLNESIVVYSEFKSPKKKFTKLNNGFEKVKFENEKLDVENKKLKEMIISLTNGFISIS